MARYKCIINLKCGIDEFRIANDSEFQRTHKNGFEYGRAGKARKVLRKALYLTNSYRKIFINN